MNWRLAKALEMLRSQVDAAFPKRRKHEDGTIGDESHQSRESDHNPWVDGNVVTALDITHDPANGCDCEALSARLLKSHDSRIKYIIWNKRIANYQALQNAKPFAWRPYHGASDHTKHMHVSVRPSKMFYDCQLPWDIVQPPHPSPEVASNKAASPSPAPKQSTAKS
jgi:hypothetical protein